MKLVSKFPELAKVHFTNWRSYELKISGNRLATLAYFVRTILARLLNLNPLPKFPIGCHGASLLFHTIDLKLFLGSQHP